jgi:hypothetical protein
MCFAAEEVLIDFLRTTFNSRGVHQTGAPRQGLCTGSLPGCHSDRGLQWTCACEEEGFALGLGVICNSCS